MEKDKLDWLNKITKIGAKKEKFEKEKERKDMILFEMAKDIGSQKESIRTGMTVSVRNKGLLGRKQRLLVDKGEQIDELDPEEVHETRGLTEEDKIKSYEAQRKVSAIMDKMQNSTKKGKVRRPKTNKDGTPQRDSKDQIIYEMVEEMVPLFTDQEIADEYDALVRERIIPESMVPDRFSKTQEMLDRTNEYYLDRLKEESAKAQKDDTDDSLLGFTKSMINKAGDLAQNAVKLAGIEEAQLASNIISLATMSLTAGIDIISAVSKSDLELSVNTILDAAEKMTQSVVSMALNDPEAGKLAAGGVRAGGTLGRIVVDLSSSPPNVKAALTAFADGFAGGFELAGTEVGMDPKILSTVLTIVPKTLERVAQIPALVKAVRDGDLQAFVDEMNKGAQAILSASMSIAKTWSDEQTGKQLEDIQGMIENCMDLEALGVKTVVGVIDAVRKKDVTAMTQALIDGIGGVMTGILKQTAPGVASEVGAAYKASTSIAKVAAYLYVDPPQVSNALKTLGSGFGDAFGLIDPGNPTVGKIGDGIGTAFESAASAVEIAKAIKEGKYDQVINGLTKIGRAIVGKALDIDLSKSEGSDSGGDDEGLTGQITVVFEGIENSSEAVGNFLASLKDDKTKEKLKANLTDKLAEEALEDIKESNEEVRRSLILVDDGGDAIARDRAIENLIKILVKKRMFLEMAVAVSKGGIAVVAKFVPGFEIGGAVVSLAANVLKAANLAMELHTWANNHRDAIKSSSVYSTSIKNFVKNQAAQFSHYTIQAALDFVQLVGSIVTLGGISAAAGQAVSKAAVLAKAAEDMMYEVYKRADLEYAWSITQKAMHNPKNRKLGLLARKHNPTLAKYSLAFGAVVKGDAIAKSAMASCGLNQVTLSNPQTNVKKVVQYLEVYFKEDNVVVRAVFVPPDWVPGNIELTAVAFAATKARGIRVAKLADDDTGAIESSLARLNTFDDKVGDAMTEEDEVTWKKEMEKLQSALSSYKPMYTQDKRSAGVLAGKDHDQMISVIGEFQTLAMDAEANLYQRSYLNISALFVGDEDEEEEDTTN